MALTASPDGSTVRRPGLRGYTPTMSGHAWQNAVSLVDRTLGDGLERQVAAHHRRRLRGLGWEHAFSPGPGLWAEASPPPRPGNALELLVDGEVALPRIAEALSLIHISEPTRLGMIS